MIYYISDIHFGHKNVIRFDNRPFSDVNEMDRAIIEYWNNRVRSEDTVYIVGDLCHRNAKPAEWYLERLNGHKYLIEGNHDDLTIKNDKALRLLEGVNQIMRIRDEDKVIQLCHYPLAEWYKYYSGTWHIYGHIHNRKNETYAIMRGKERALNAGCMINNYTPVTFEELIKNNKAFEKYGIGRDTAETLDD